MKARQMKRELAAAAAGPGVCAVVALPLVGLALELGDAHRRRSSPWG